VSPNAPYGTKTVLVFGASGAIGSACVRMYAAQGFSVGLIGRQTARLAQLADEAMRLGASAALPVVADLTKADETARAVNACTSALGVHSIVVCAAGEFQAAGGGLSSGRRPSGDLTAIERNVVCYATPALRRQQGGAVVLMTSSLCKMGATSLSSLPNLGTHVVWSNAVLGLSEILLAELRAARVRVNCLVLGFTNSAYGRALVAAMGGAVTPELATKPDAWVQPHDVARQVGFITDPRPVCGCVAEVLLQPAMMHERNHLFNDVKRVEAMVEALPGPFRDGKVALVTGCGKGIGRGIALELCRAGFDLVAITRTAADLDSLERECAAMGRRVVKLPMDVTDEAKMARAVQTAVDTFGTLTCVVVNAGTNRRRVAALADMKSWREVVEVDQMAAMNLGRLSLPWLIRHAKQTKVLRPSLVFISTGYAHPKGVSMNGLASYVTSKRATNAFAAVLLQEVRDFGVQVTAIDVGTVATDLGLKPNAAAKNTGELIDPAHLLQPACCGRLVVHLCEGSAGTAVQEINLENLHHKLSLFFIKGGAR